MADILGKPAQLRQTACNLNHSARKIRATLDDVNATMRNLGPARFDRQHTDALRAHHPSLHGDLLHTHEKFLHMVSRNEIRLWCSIDRVNMKPPIKEGVQQEEYIHWE